MESPKIQPIAEDFRGASWSLMLPNGQELVLIYTKKGMYRGGHSHNFPETSIVISGKMQYKKKFPDGREIEFEHGAGEVLHNEPNEVHVAQATEDGWLLDVKAAKQSDWVTTNYPAYRAKVDEQVKQFGGK